MANSKGLVLLVADDAKKELAWVDDLVDQKEVALDCWVLLHTKIDDTPYKQHVFRRPAQVQLVHLEVGAERKCEPDPRWWVLQNEEVQKQYDLVYFRTASQSEATTINSMVFRMDERKRWMPDVDRILTCDPTLVLDDAFYQHLLQPIAPTKPSSVLCVVGFSVKSPPAPFDQVDCWTMDGKKDELEVVSDHLHVKNVRAITRGSWCAFFRHYIATADQYNPDTVFVLAFEPLVVPSLFMKYRREHLHPWLVQLAQKPGLETLDKFETLDGISWLGRDLAHFVACMEATDDPSLLQLWCHSRSGSGRPLIKFGCPSGDRPRSVLPVVLHRDTKVSEQQLRELKGLRQTRNFARFFDLVDGVLAEVQRLDPFSLYGLLVEAVQAALDHERPDQAMHYLSFFQWCQIDNSILQLSDNVLRQWKKANSNLLIRASVTPKPESKSVQVVFGNYYHGAQSLFTSPTRPIQRHPCYAQQMKDVIDEFEFDSAWDWIDRIYVINMDSRPDRYFNTLLELCKLRAPLHRVVRVSAKTGPAHLSSFVASTIGVSASQLVAVQNFASDPNLAHAVFLEDDFSVDDSVEQHLADLRLFFSRGYDYDVCLWASSKFWNVQPYDDLLQLSFQACTTCAGYMLSKAGAAKLLPVWTEGLSRLESTHDTNTYACDRYWAKLQADKRFFLFQRKIGFQRPSMSTITNTFACNFD